MLIGTMLANAELNGITGREAQMAHVRDLLDMAIECATLLAHTAGSSGDG